MSPRFLTTGESARALGVTSTRIRRMIATGDLDAEKVGRDWLISVTEIERRQRQHRPGGRPWSPERAHRFLVDVDDGRIGFSELETNAHKLRHRPPTDTLAAQWLDAHDAGNPTADRIKHRLLRRHRAGPPS